MAVTRSEWNAVVVGDWNRAILTPAWIGKHLFGLEPGTPLEVQVTLDEYRPHQVKYGGIVVMASSSQLIAKPVANEFADLGRAALVAAKAITELPRTPLTGAGINCVFKSDTPIEKLSQVTGHPADKAFDDFKISSRGTSRALKWHDGYVNVLADDDENQGRTILFNFHLADKDEEHLAAWLARPIAEIEDAVTKILKKYLDIELQETADAKTE